MKITGFDISNFKGVRNAKIRFSENDMARVHTLVGLNESGKTTLLEAMHSFSPDAETELVVKNARNVDEQREQWVPRDKISIFTGEVSVTAYVYASEDDWAELQANFERLTGLLCHEKSFPSHFTVRLVHSYRNGDFLSSARNINLPNLKVKSKRAKKYRPLKSDELNAIGRLVRNSMPTVAYYPTFVFDFPKRIYLTNRDGSPRNRFYRQLFQDILDFDGSGYTIEESILARLHKEESQSFWESWFSAFVGTTEEDKVKQVISRAERAVSRLVFSKWNEVFGEKVGAKEIAIDLQYEKGKTIVNEDGTEDEPVTHDAYIRFRIKDGSNLYSVEDRSLGFRWFFSFLLFTQFRIHRERQRPTIFLFDEPASNLHAAAQKKLLESFPAIAKPPHRLIYSTHSHYMVEPKWLEQAYIVFDQSAVSDGDIIDASIHEDATVDVLIVPYRQFVQERPAQTSYFQPILDTLEVQPSKFDYKIGGLIVEGKSDFYFLKFASLVTGEDIGPIFPARGSGTMGALVSLHRGWGLPVRILFDADRGGKDGRRNLMKEYSLEPSELTDLGQVMGGMKQIEDLLDTTDKKRLVAGISGNTKTILLRKIQEYLASSFAPPLSSATKRNMSTALLELREFIVDEKEKSFGAARPGEKSFGKSVS